MMALDTWSILIPPFFYDSFPLFHHQNNFRLKWEAPAFGADVSHLSLKLSVVVLGETLTQKDVHPSGETNNMMMIPSHRSYSYTDVTLHGNISKK